MVAGNGGGDVVVVVEKEPSAVLKGPSAVSFSDPQQQEENELVLAARPTPILKPKPAAISYIDQPAASSSSSTAAVDDAGYLNATHAATLPSPSLHEHQHQQQQRQQQLSVTFMDDRTNNNNNNNNNTNTNTNEVINQEGEVAPPSLVASGGSGLQGGVSSYVRELLAVGVQDRAEGFSRSAQSNSSRVYGSTNGA